MSPIKVGNIHPGAGARQEPTFIGLSKSISFKSCFSEHFGLWIMDPFCLFLKNQFWAGFVSPKR